MTAQHTTCVIHNILIVTCPFGHILPYDSQQKSYPVTKAGPSALAGLMHMELTGPRIHMSRQIAKGTAKGPNFPQPLQTGSFSDIQPSCTGHATVTENTDTMLCLIFVYRSQSTIATCSWYLQGLLRQRVNIRNLPLVDHHAHQDKYKEEGRIHFSQECLCITQHI